MSISSCSITSGCHQFAASNLALKSFSPRLGRATSLRVLIFSEAFFSPFSSKTWFIKFRGKFFSSALFPSAISRSFSPRIAIRLFEAKPISWPNFVSLISALS